MIKNKAIFLDRDGTLIKSLIKDNTKNFKLRPPYTPNELRVFGDLSFLNLLSKKYLLIIISNQPDLYTNIQSLKFHNFINLQIKKKIYVKDFFFCKCLKSDPKCNCYKPKTTMIKKAILKYNISIKHSYFIGDTWRDVKIANNVNLKSILIDRGFYNNLKNEFIMNNAKFDFKIKSFHQLKDIIKF